jgi:hypothetical protein
MLADVEPSPVTIPEPADAAFDDIFLTTEQLAARYQQEPGTLHNARCRGEGAPWVKTSTGAVRYRLADILAAEAAGTRGFSWRKLKEALDEYRGLTAGETERLLKHLKERMRG